MYHYRMRRPASDMPSRAAQPVLPRVDSNAISEATAAGNGQRRSLYSAAHHHGPAPKHRGILPHPQRLEMMPMNSLEHARFATRSAAQMAVAIVLGACAPSPSFAWGVDGHRLVAEQAQRLLSPAARLEVDRLLALEPGDTLASISSWADENRSRETASWHYVNFPRDSGCVYVPPRDCPGGTCVVGAIERQEALLASKAPDADRLVALKYLVHFVADVHQPLHAGYGDDTGGNTFQVQFDGRGSSLHAVWDSGLIRARPGGLDALRNDIQASATAAPDKSTPAQWAEESCRAVESSGFYPNGRILSSAYAERMDAILVGRLAAASSRLAGALNATLGSR